MSKLFEFMGNFVSELFFEDEGITDGGLQCILKIIERYKKNYKCLNLKKLIDVYYPRTSFEALFNIAKENELSCKIINKVSFDYFQENNQPFLFKSFNHISDYNFLICFSYSEVDGFDIWDYRHGQYYASVKGFKDMWDGGDCLFFST